MASLIEDVLSIEHQANQIVEKAHNEAKSIEKSAQTEIERIRADIDAQVEERVAAYRREAEQKHNAALESEKQEAARRLGELDRMDEGLIQKLAGTVVAEFRGR